MINLSEKYKSFIWTPNRTGSTLASLVLKNEEFGFELYDEKKVKTSDFYKHHHYYYFFEGHENYNFLMTVRNPYNQYLSFMGYKINPDSSDHLERMFQNEEHRLFMLKLKQRKPDYVLRIESLYEDYCKIPFIKDSNFNKSGDLKKLVDSKPNQLKQKPDFQFNQQIADLIYYNNLVIFDMFGYEKDSWKKI